MAILHNLSLRARRCAQCSPKICVMNRGLEAASQDIQWCTFRGDLVITARYQDKRRPCVDIPNDLQKLRGCSFGANLPNFLGLYVPTTENLFNSNPQNCSESISSLFMEASVCYYSLHWRWFTVWSRCLLTGTSSQAVTLPRRTRPSS